MLNIDLISCVNDCSSTPCLLGTKIVQRYFRGEGYLEIDLHIGSSGIANNVVGLCRKYVSAFVCNLGSFLHQYFLRRAIYVVAVWDVYLLHLFVWIDILCLLVNKVLFYISSLSLCADMDVWMYFVGVVIQGESSEELPERVLMCMSMVKMQLRQQVGVTAPHVEYVHAFLREQMNLPMPLISPSAKMLQEENSSS